MNVETAKQKFTVERKIAIIMAGIFVLSLVPLLVIAFCNVMCADDYSYGFLAHRAFRPCYREDLCR